MKRGAWILLAAAGCIPPHNPWDTTRERADYEAAEDDAAVLLLVPLRTDPQAEEPSFVDPSLEGWRDTVLAAADGATLGYLRHVTKKKIAVLEAKRAELLALDGFTRAIPLTRAEDELRIERLRLEMIDARVERSGRGD